MTLLAYRDSSAGDAYELMDDTDAEHDHNYLAGTEKYVFGEWGKRNRQLIEDGFQRDNLSGDYKWHQFIS